MQSYQVRLTLKSGFTFTIIMQVNCLDDVYECVAWDYPTARIIGANAIQRIA